jgi:sensor histidine kinase YesM
MMLKIKEKYVRLVGIPVLGAFLALLFCDGPYPSLAEIAKTTSFTLVFWQGTFTIISFLRNKFPQIEQTGKRLTYTVIFTILFLIIADTIIRLFFDHFFPSLNWEIDSLPMHWLKNIFISFLVAMIYELVYFYNRWNQSRLETQKLKTQQISSQLETLKNQISPHFLFNSLNTLAAIIPEDEKMAVKFTEKLSEVYRYILTYKDKELVPLTTELEFVKSYLFLLKMRYPHNLQVDYRIHEHVLQKHVAPLTLQMLVENAIKHNVISKSKPLKIEIYTEDKGSIVVRNKLQRKVISTQSTKTGLENIKKRYQYLSDKTVDIITTSTNFMVAVPLIQLNEEAS